MTIRASLDSSGSEGGANTKSSSYESSFSASNGGGAAGPKFDPLNLASNTARRESSRLDAATLSRDTVYRTRQEIRLPPADANPDVKLGVLLLQLGGPESMDDVEGFLYNLFADPGKRESMCVERWAC